MPAGYAGKLPAYGDFVEGGGAVRSRQEWSAWAERGLASARDAAGGGFPDIFLTSPIWRFAVSSGVFGSAPVAGVFCPSMDKVGRLFPFAVVAELSEGAAPVTACAALGPWFDQLEAAVLAALDPEATLDQLSDALPDPFPVASNGGTRAVAATPHFSALAVTADGEPKLDQGDPLDLSDEEPDEGDGVWITLGGVDDAAHGVMQHGTANDALFTRLVMGGEANGL